MFVFLDRTPGILKYQEDYDRAVTLPRDTFIQAAEKFLGVCNADTYVFINQPGLRKLDFLEFETEFVSLQRYIRRSSTAIKFEKVDLLPQDLYSFFAINKGLEIFCIVTS